MASKKNPKIDDAEAGVNFRYGLGIMQQNGDTAGLAKAKKENPKLYADWEQRNAGAKNAASVEKKSTAAPKKAATAAKKTTPVRKAAKK